MSAATRYWLGLGANIGDPRRAMAEMLRGLEGEGMVLEAISSLYDTAPRDLVDQPAFLNAAARVRGDLDPPGLLSLVKRLEREIGRVPGVRYGPRAIDCDLLLWSGGAWETPELQIPHPRLSERRFVLVPLVEIDPDLTLPTGEALQSFHDAIAPDEQPVAMHSPGDSWATVD